MGLAGERMQARGMRSLFPIADVAVMGLGVDRRAPAAHRPARAPDGRRRHRGGARCARHHRQPGSHACGRAGAWRGGGRSFPIIDYVSPTVWAWRAYRARRMRALCRPRAGASAVRAGGASAARRAALHLCRPSADRAARRASARAGRARAARRAAGAAGASRQPAHGDLAAAWRRSARRSRRIAAARPDVEVLLPAVPHLARRDRRAYGDWPRQPTIVLGEAREIRGVPPRACGARRLRHGDAGARRSPACRWSSPIASIR